MFLIAELNEDVQYITEDKGDGKRLMYIEGCFLQANIKNRNGRIYPLPLLEREVGRYHKELISANRAMGELGHPNGPGLNLDRVSHLVKECRRNGNDFIGKAQILDTPMGKIAESLIAAGARLGVSSRGMGTIKEDSKLGAKVVQDDFRLAVMIDIVADPSAPGAWVDGIMENVQWKLNELGEWVHEEVHRIQETVHSLPLSSLTVSKKSELLENFIETMLEQEMIDDLARVAKVDPDIAAAAIQRAKIKAKITAGKKDPGFVWRTARSIVDSPEN